VKTKYTAKQQNYYNYNFIKLFYFWWFLLTQPKLFNTFPQTHQKSHNLDHGAHSSSKQTLLCGWNL